ncbi:MAG: LytTR family transcriptional regulator, partial [Caulobacter sp.]
MSLTDRRAALKRLAIDLLLLTVLGLVLGVLSPFGTAQLSPAERFIYWLLSIVGGGLIGVAVDEVLGRRIE